MLSPASLRVCCLAVMAPALTKADRRAECLPVSLSDPFCESKTVAPYNRKDKHIEAHFPKLSSKFAYLLNNRLKAYRHKTWYRTQIKNPEFCPPPDFHNGKRNAEFQSEAWHGTSVALAVADKVRLKYTMNKSSLKNMGLARTNASLSLQSMKKTNRITQFSPKEKGGNTPDIGESSPDLPDSTHSELETGLLITRLTQTPTEQSFLEDVSSSSIEADPSRSSSSEGDVNLPVTCASPAAEAASENCSIQMPSANTKNVNLYLPVALTDSICVSTHSTSEGNVLPFHPASQSSKKILPFCTSSEVSSLRESSNIQLTLKDASSNSESSSFVESNLNCLIFEPDDHLSACSLQTMGLKKPSIAQLTFGDAIKPRLHKVPKRKDCCFVDSEILNKKYSEEIQRIVAVIEKTELLVRICISAYSKQEIGELVQSYQTKLGIPCQKQLKKKDMVELKAELLQSEDVKSLSTSALVNLVRKLESSGSPGNLLPTSQNISLPNADDPSGEATAFAPEDIANVILTARELLESVKRELKYVDPDLTDSSDDEESDLEYHETKLVHKMALWKLMKERAALTCRTTWLIARIHELENQLRTAGSALQKLTSVCSEFTAGNVETKGFTRHVNGYLDHIAHIGQLESSFSEVKPATQECSRTLALSTFHKRDVLVTTGLHFTNTKLSRLSNVNCHCSCQEEILPCVLCMGRYHCVQSVDPDSMPLLDRISLLDSDFHPLLSFHKDVPITLHFESILKKNESQYQIVRPVSPALSQKSLDDGYKPTHFSIARARSRKLNRYARTLSAKYRNKHLRNTRHLRKHGLIFGKWRRYQRSSFQARDRFRRISIDSSGSSHDSPVPSPNSVFEDGCDGLRRRREDNQFDINDVIIPYSNKTARLVEFEFKDIVVPSFRIEQNETENLMMQHSSDALLKEFVPIEENTLEEAYLARHDPLEIDEKKINRRLSVTDLDPNPKRCRREYRLDSRADSSGANTPDLFDQDMFQDHNSLSVPTSPPHTPLHSDDSQPSLGSFAARFDRKKLSVKRPSEDSVRQCGVDTEDVVPYEVRSFPLTNEQFEEIALDPYGEDFELTISGPSSPASPGSTTQSTSTIEEDVTDPEWMVLRNNPTFEPGLKLKLAKR